MIAGDPEGPFYIHGDLRVDVMAHVTTFRGMKIDFSPIEEALFYTLVHHAGKLVTCKHLLRAIWGSDVTGKTNNLHFYIQRLRKKLKKNTNDLLIQTNAGLGYRLLIPPGTQKS